jgi:hypothetical protein
MIRNLVSLRIYNTMSSARRKHGTVSGLSLNFSLMERKTG